MTTPPSTDPSWTSWTNWSEWVSPSEQPSTASVAGVKGLEQASNWPSLPPYPFEPNSIASILSTFPNPNVFPFELTSSTNPTSKFWETTDTQIESEWTFFPRITPPIWTEEPRATRYPHSWHRTTNVLGPDTATEPSVEPEQSLGQSFATPILPQINDVEVLPLTVGNIMSMTNGDFEWASTITLIRDGDKTILVDTGLPADTNILIRGKRD